LCGLAMVQWRTAWLKCKWLRVQSRRPHLPFKFQGLLNYIVQFLWSEGRIPPKVGTPKPAPPLSWPFGDPKKKRWRPLAAAVAPGSAAHWRGSGAVAP